MTAPYAAAAAALLPGAIGHQATVTAYPLSGAPFTVPVEDGDLEVSFSEDWSPHVQVRATAAVPADQAQLDALDGRLACRLTIDAGYVYPDRTVDVHLLADVGLRDRSVRRPDNTMELAAYSDEIKTQDRRRTDTTATPVFAGVNEAIKWCVDLGCWPEIPTIVSDFGAAYGASFVSGLEVPVGQQLWDPVGEVANRAGLRVYVQGDRTWRIRGRANVGTSVHRLEVGKAGTIIESETGLSREDWANYVILEYGFKNTSGVQVKVFGRAALTDGPYRPAAVGYRMHVDQRTVSVTQTQANYAAASVLRHMMTRGRSMTLTAGAAYWVRPGQTVEVQLPTGAAELHIVKSVTFHPLKGTMTLTTRMPYTATITLGE